MAQRTHTAPRQGTTLRMIAAVSAVLYSGFTFATSIVGVDTSYRASLWVFWAIVMAVAFATYYIGVAMGRPVSAPEVDASDRIAVLTAVN